MSKAIKVHPLCRKFHGLAKMPDEELAQMKADIEANGIKLPILVNKNRDTILDGLTRWEIAHDLKLKLDPRDPECDCFEVFEGSDDEIQAEILSRNLYRRHITDDDRVVIIGMFRGPQLEKEARERMKKGRPPRTYPENKIGSGRAGSFGKPVPEGGSVAEQIAKEAGVSKHKGEQEEKARKAGMLDDVLDHKIKLREAAKKAGKKSRKPTGKAKITKPPFADEVYKKWTAWLNRFGSQRREVMELVVTWVLGRSDLGKSGETIAPVSVAYPDGSTATIEQLIARKREKLSENGGAS
jgi:hypothetical protein